MSVCVSTLLIVPRTPGGVDVRGCEIEAELFGSVNG